MKRLLAVRIFAVFVLIMLALGTAPVLAEDSPGSANTNTNTTVNGPTPNPYLASSLYGIVHFDSSSSDAMPYGPPKGVYVINPAQQPIAYGGPGTIMTLASTHPQYMWHPSTDRLQYIRKSGGGWVTVAEMHVLNKLAKDTFPKISDKTLRAFGKATAVGMTPTTLIAQMKSLFGDNYASRGGGGVYSLVDNKNVFYSMYNGVILGFALKDENNPAAGIKIKYRLDDPVTKIQGTSGARVVALQMTYDGHLVVTFSNGLAIIDRELTLSTNSYYAFGTGERVTNSTCVDENNAVYVASNTVMRKLVWTGTALSDHAGDGAWSCPYTTDSSKAPIGRMDNGTGSTPTLMGFGNDADKLVIITDGAKVMNLVAFWRDEIPSGFTDRVAGQIPVTCGFNPVPEWIQSEQSVVVRGYGAFVENNVPESIDAELLATPSTYTYLLGPAYTPARGVERFAWDTTTHSWSSTWARTDAVGSPIPSYSAAGNMVLITGWIPDVGWAIHGMDWDTGDTVHLTFLGQKNFGNGLYGLLQGLKNGDLLFNGVCGTIRLHYEQ
ncbi:MAG: hypothetical protein ABFD97_18795 [Syntrophobacter sp.]